MSTHRLPLWLGTKPLLYTIAGLVLVVIGLSIAYERRGMQVDVANAASSSAMSLARAVTAERDAWKGRAEELQLSVQAHQAAMDTLRTELQRAQDQAATIRARNEQALASVRAELREANATLSAFIDRYQVQVRTPACGAALNQLEAACPALSTY